MLTKGIVSSVNAFNSIFMLESQSVATFPDFWQRKRGAPPAQDNRERPRCRPDAKASGEIRKMAKLQTGLEGGLQGSGRVKNFP
jgi:hypothetical protein